MANHKKRVAQLEAWFERANEDIQRRLELELAKADQASIEETGDHATMTSEKQREYKRRVRQLNHQAEQQWRRVEADRAKAYEAMGMQPPKLKARHAKPAKVDEGTCLRRLLGRLKKT